MVVDGAFVGGILVPGLLLALILNTKGLAFRPLYRIILILPWAVPNYITALIWKGMFNKQFGAINGLLTFLGLEPVAWFYDHSESTRSKPCYKNAFCYVVCTLQIGRNVATVDLRLYLRERTVRRLNRKLFANRAILSGNDVMSGTSYALRIKYLC